MSMTMQDYIVRFGVEGLNNLDIAVLGMSKLDTAVAKSSASLSSTLSIAARDAGISFSNLGEVIGTKTVRSFAQFEQGGTRVIGNIKQMQAAILQADGAIVKLNYNMQRTGNGMYTYMGGSGNASGVGPKTANSMVPGAGETSAVQSALALAGRAALTIPIWMALRTVMTSVSDTATEGVKRMSDLDLAVAQMSTLTSGAFDAVAAKKAVDDLSLATGKSVNDLRDVYKNLAESGLDTKTSLEGMKVVTMGSIASFADAVPLARTMAGALNILGSKFDEGASKGEKLNAMMGVMYALWQTNGGLMDDYVGALRNAGAAASVTGTGFAELMANIATMHTGLQLGSQAGNAWRMAVNDLSKPKTQSAALNLLGQDSMTPEQSSDANKFLSDIIEKLYQLQQMGQTPAATNSILNTLFGQKGGRDPATIVSLIDIYRDNVQKVTDLMKNPATSGDAYMKSAGTQLSTMSAQFEIMHNIIADMGANFLGGLFNIQGKDPVEILQNMNAELTKMKDGAEGFGKALHDALLPLSILVGVPLLGAGANLAGVAGGAGMAGVAGKLESIANRVQLPAASMAEGATSNLGAAAYGAGAGGVGAWLARLAQPAAGAALGEGTSAIGGVAGVAAGALPAMISAIITIAVPATLAYLTSLGLAKIPIGQGKNLGDLAGATMSDMWDSVRHPLGDNGMFGKNGIFSVTNNPNSAMEQVLNPSDPYAIPDSVKKKALGDLGTIPGSKPAFPATVPLDTLKDLTAEYDKMKQYGIDDLQIKIEALANLKDQLSLNLTDTDRAALKKQIESDTLAIQKEQTAEANKYADTLQKGISTNLLDSLQNKKGTPGLFQSMTDTVHKQFQTNIADNASKVIMSSGIGSVSGGLFGAMDDATRSITQPILQAHIDGGAAVHDAILTAWAQATGKDMSGYMSAGGMKGGMNGVSSSGPSGSNSNLPGIWGTAPFSNHYLNGSVVGAGTTIPVVDDNGNVVAFSNTSPSNTSKLLGNKSVSSYGTNGISVTGKPGLLDKSGWSFDSTSPMSYGSAFGNYIRDSFGNHQIVNGFSNDPLNLSNSSLDNTLSGGTAGWSLSSPNASGSILNGYNPSNPNGMTWGTAGALGSLAAGSSMMIAGGVSQIQGGGAKNITSGIGGVAAGIGGAAMGLGVGGTAGLGAAIGLTSAALAPIAGIGLLIGAVATIASLFMKSNNSSTQTQTSETKVASKIDVSNQKLELINRNLLALGNTMASFALANSAYFSEKNGAIDSQFALGAARSLY